MIANLNMMDFMHEAYEKVFEDKPFDFFNHYYKMFTDRPLYEDNHEEWINYILCHYRQYQHSKYSNHDAQAHSLIDGLEALLLSYQDEQKKQAL